MVNGVLFYNRGTKCLVRLLVSITSLRKYYIGQIALACEGELAEWVIPYLDSMEVKRFSVATEATHHLAVKSSLWRSSPFDVTLFMDSDVLIRGPIDDLFDLAKARQCVVTQQHEWVSTGRIMGGRIRQWDKIAPKAVAACIAKPLPAINTGVVGWKKGASVMPAYEEMTRKAVADRNIMRKTLDEISMQLAVVEHPHIVVPAKWNMGCQYGDGLKAVIVHYHGYKHCRGNANGELWRAAFWDLAQAHQELELTTKRGDNCVDRWLGTSFKRKDDLTIVTAVSPAYAAAAKQNLAIWRRTPGLREQRLVIFVAGFKNKNQRAFLDGPNTKVIRWDYPFECTERERMLSAFVLGAAREVQTQYWVKLDVDCKPMQPFVVWPDYKGFSVVSHPWNYTKIKGDNPKRHWLNTCQDVFEASNRLPELDPIKDRRYGHKRFASFCHIERTEFTRKIADIAQSKCGGRLPIPSHDTLSWAATDAWGEKVKLVNMKTLFNPH